MKKNNNWYFLGCPCHTIHDTAHARSSVFTKVSGFDVEDFCIDLYFFFGEGSKRKNVLMEYTQFCNQEYGKILKHLNVRWLSLELVVERLLKQYASLKSYFLSEEAPTASGKFDFAGLNRIKRSKKPFEDTMTEVYLYFYYGVLPMFNHAHLLLQWKDPCIYSVKEKFMRNHRGARSFKSR